MEEERIGLFLDFENIAIGARDLGIKFDFKPIADALAERGRVVVRRAYADWSMFDDERRELTRHHVELIEIPQRMGMVRKNAADIKLAVDAIELSLEREYITTFVIGTGDSDFTPLVHKLREHNKRVIGLGVEASTSNLLPAACDEFLFYERLPGIDQSPRTARRGGARGGGRRTKAVDNGGPPAKSTDIGALDVLVTQTLSGLKRRGDDSVLASNLKRTLLRKDPTFDESVYGFRSLAELLRNLAERDVIQLTDGAPGDPAVDFPEAKTGAKSGEEEAFALLRDVVASLGSPQLPGLKNQLRRRQRGFTEKRYGYGGFLQFCKAAQARGYVDMEWDDTKGVYVLGPAGSLPKPQPDERTPADEEPARTPLIAVPAPADEPPVEREPVAEAEPVLEAEVLDVSDATDDTEAEAEAEAPAPAKKKRTPRKSTAKPRTSNKAAAKTKAKRTPRASKTAAKD
jgi:uncharacterized protein (TIGR00288 family)